MATMWGQYLSVPGAGQAYRELHTRCRAGYAPVRAVLRRVVEKTAPSMVACLGAGVLNDIPYRKLLQSGAVIHLVDWLPGVIESGIAQSIITRDADGAPRCEYCVLGNGDAALFCRQYHKAADAPDRVCDRYEPGDGDPATCRAFELGERPFVHCRDVTGGYAESFGAGVDRALEQVETWKQAFRQATALLKKIRHHRTSLDIPDGSVDLVTSSMVVSQFEHEPYGYFSKRAADRLGRPDAKQQKRLQGTMETLRDQLLTDQVDYHCDEIERMLAPGGVCFMAFELFHYDPDTHRWFLIDPMQETLSRLGRRFDFDFDLLPAAESMVQASPRDEPSVIQFFALRPKGA